MPVPDLVRRERATEKTLARYRDRPFSWRSATCIHLARKQARGMGHKVPKMPRISGPKSAMRALRAMGVADIDGLFVKMGFEPIAPAAMNLGDLVILPGSDGFDAVGINVGGGKVMGWSEQADGRMVALTEVMASIKSAWRL